MQYTKKAVWRGIGVKKLPKCFQKLPKIISIEVLHILIVFKITNHFGLLLKANLLPITLKIGQSGHTGQRNLYCNVTIFRATKKVTLNDYCNIALYTKVWVESLENVLSIRIIPWCCWGVKILQGGGGFPKTLLRASLNGLKRKTSIPLGDWPDSLYHVWKQNCDVAKCCWRPTSWSTAMYICWDQCDHIGRFIVIWVTF